MKFISKVLIVILAFLNYEATFATVLADLQPHSPSKSPWSEQWFYVIQDPHIGLLKFSFQTYIPKNTAILKEKAYIHIAVHPLNGKIITYDYYYDELILDRKDPNHEDFSFEIPGVFVANEQSFHFSSDEVSFQLNLTGPHQHYWPHSNPGQTPFGFISDLPSISINWFMYSMGTDSTYSFQDKDQSYSGQALTYIDKGWFHRYQTNGFYYLLGLDQQHQLMVTGAKIGQLPFEIWAGRYISPTENWILHPKLAGIRLKRTFDICQGTFNLSAFQQGKKVEIIASTSTNQYYLSSMPTVKIFKSSQAVKKYMDAKIKVSLYLFNKLIDEHHFKQGLLEFSGPRNCNHS